MEIILIVIEIFVSKNRFPSKSCKFILQDTKYRKVRKSARKLFDFPTKQTCTKEKHNKLYVWIANFSNKIFHLYHKHIFQSTFLYFQLRFYIYHITKSVTVIIWNNSLFFVFLIWQMSYTIRESCQIKFY